MLVLVSMAEQQKREQPVAHEAAVATAVPARALMQIRRRTPLRVIAVIRAPFAKVGSQIPRNRLRSAPNELTTASQPFKRNGLSP